MRSVRNERGQSLVQILVAVGLMGILMAAFAQMMTNQMRETKALSEKLASLDLEKLLIAALADGSVCGHVLNNPAPLTFDSTKPLPQYIEGPPGQPIKLYTSIVHNPPGPDVPGPVAAEVGKPASAMVPSLTVQRIRLAITDKVGSAYKGNWEVILDPTGTTRSLRPIAISTFLGVNASIPTAAKVLVCQQSSNPTTSGWVKPPGGGLIPMLASYNYWTTPNAHPANICKNTGYTTYTGNCRGSYGALYPSLSGTLSFFEMSFFGTDYYFLTCIWWPGYYSFSPDYEILCTNVL
jgi:type II secretory pathway pseudopilin PulG